MGATSKTQVTRDPRSPFGIGRKEKTEQEKQIEALQAQIKGLEEKVGQFSQPKQTTTAAPSSAYALSSTLGGQRGLRIASSEPKASSIRRRNRAM